MLRAARLTTTGLLLLSLATVSPAAEPEVPPFAEEILPLLKVHCVRCHGPALQEGELNLAIKQGIRRGGKSGPAVTAGSPAESLLWRLVESDEMPADEPMPAEEKQKLKRWIAAGAPGLPETVTPRPAGEEHWAFQKFAEVQPPSVNDETRIRTEIDRFIQARLERAGLEIGPEATREALIRRVCLDLTGLPPTPDELAQFLADTSGNAYEEMVERYLNSERYGERWGKYWLDASGYADSNGYFGRDSDRPLAYRYRDYVIRSINEDRPWDQFIREQLAGDEIAGYTTDSDIRPEMLELLVAAHFLRNSPDGTDASDGNADEVRADKYAVLEGTLQIMGSSLLGMTVQCARCHDHKFEPFSQRDYYQLQALLFPVSNVDHWITPDKRVVTVATADERDTWKEETRKIDELIAQQRESFADWTRQNRLYGTLLFADAFDGRPQGLAEHWTNTVPLDQAPAGTPPVKVDGAQGSAARMAENSLEIIEGGEGGDRALSTRLQFDWTPAEVGSWIQATFDLVSGRATAPYVGYFVALRDFNDAEELAGGNILIDGAASGQAGVHVDYPGADSRSPGKIGKRGYAPGHNYGVRITNLGEGKFELAQLVDGQLEESRLTLAAADLPDGAFGFEYCCGRSFVVDNVVIESGSPALEMSAEGQAWASARKDRQAEMEEQIKKLETARPQPLPQLAIVSTMAAEKPEVHLLERGSYQAPGEVVLPQPPHVLVEGDPALSTTEAVSAEAPEMSRLGFADWLIAADSRASALLARVTVNRWWAHHFGTGLAATTDNLGYSGAPPTHPELLEYLAQQLVRGNWSAKAWHRQILHSAVYRQESTPTQKGMQVDARNQLLSHFSLRRLDAEALRDSLLAASGDLDLKMYGPYVATRRAEDGDVVVASDSSGKQRRSVYLQQRRTQVVGLLEVFDAPSIVFNCTARTSTTVPLQSLKLLNSDFIRQRAESLAKLVSQQAGAENETAGIVVAHRLALSRDPDEEELRASQEFLKSETAEYGGDESARQKAWVDFCQMILVSNAFLYVE